MALYIASHRGHLEALHYLLEHGDSDGQLSMVKSWGPLQVERTDWLVFLVPSAMVSRTSVSSTTNPGPHWAPQSLSEVS